jgi:CHAD domain-containing protein
MSYEIKLSGRIGHALLEVARDEIGQAIEMHGEMQKGDVGEAAHEIRKCIKKLRAVFALLREPLGKTRYHEQDDLLRKIGRSLGAKRDAEVLLKTLKRLQERFFPGRPSPLIRSTLVAFAGRERRCLAHLTRSNAVAAGRATLKALLADLGTWPVTDYGWKELRHAVRRSYERARTAYCKAKDDPSAKRLHQWRKRVKEMWFHVRLLRKAGPAFMEELAQDFDVLGEFLGDDHDLLVLKAALKKRAEGKEQAAARETLFELIELRREELLDAAFDLGERLHDESPGNFVRALDERREERRKRKRKEKKLGAQLVGAP